MIDAATLEKIKVEVGQQFASYSALCKYLQVTAATGKQRQRDQERMQQYFQWEKAEGSNRITITETYYDSPKLLEDKRKGIHTTKLGGIMQQLILQAEWESTGYSKRKMLGNIGLMLPNKIITGRTKALQDVERKLFALLDSACSQLNKRELASIVTETKGIHPYNSTEEDVEEHSFSEEDFYRFLSEDEIRVYNDLRQETLHRFGAITMRDIYLNKDDAEYWRRLDEAVFRAIGLLHVRQEIYVRILSSIEKQPGLRDRFLEELANTLCSNYRTGKYSGAIGCVNAEAYEKDIHTVLAAIKHPVQKTPMK